jgi:hypothetical protein
MLGRATTVLSREQGAGQYSVALSWFNFAAGRYIVCFKAADIEKSPAIVLTR